MRAIVFPGQGAQSIGMGKALFEKYGALTSSASNVLGYSIAELCLEGPEQRLADTRFTQPALYVVGALSYLHYMETGGEVPAMVAGHSLGEYNALFAAGVFDFETGLRIVLRRAELMGEAQGGGMASIVGLSAAEVRDILRDNGLNDIHLANLNAPKQVVISGAKEAIVAAKRFFSKRAQLYQVLRVGGAFHSPFMADAHRRFASFLSDFTFDAPRYPVVSNVTARPYGPDVGGFMARQMMSEVRWSESVRYIWGCGIEDFVELGHGKSLTGLVARIKKEATPFVIATDSAPSLAPMAQARESARRPASPPPVSWQGLGSAAFRERYDLRCSYMANPIRKGISSPQLVVAMAKAGLLGFLGSDGLSMSTVERQIRSVKSTLGHGRFGVSFPAQWNLPILEEYLADILLREKVETVEASSFLQLTPALVRLRVKGLHRASGGMTVPATKVIARVSHPDVAKAFLSPPPVDIVSKLLAQNRIDREEAELARMVPMADDICVEADEGCWSETGATAVLLPAIMRLRDEMRAKFRYAHFVGIGSGGGISTPEAAAAAFVLGADFIATDSINQCTVESGASATMKELLQDMGVQDVASAPSGSLFELGGTSQVLKKGLCFPHRATRLYDLFRTLNSVDEIDCVSRDQIESKYFNRSIADVWRETQEYYTARLPLELERAHKSARHKMALIFKWYFGYTTRLALEGERGHKGNFQIRCGADMGAFNQWVRGTDIADWQRRHVHDIATRIMSGAAGFLGSRVRTLVAA